MVVCFDLIMIIAEVIRYEGLQYKFDGKEYPATVAVSREVCAGTLPLGFRQSARSLIIVSRLELGTAGFR